MPGTDRTMRFWDGLAGLIFRWRLALILASLVVAAAAATGLPRLEFDTQQDTLVPRESALFRDNERYQTAFGGGELVVLFDGDPLALLQGANLDRVEKLHLAIGRNPHFARVVSPYTILGAAEAEAQRRSAEGAGQIATVQSQAASAARTKALAEGKTAEEADLAAATAGAAAIAKFIAEQLAGAKEFASVGALSASNPKFVKAVLFTGDSVVRPELRDLVPDSGHALLVATIKGNLSIGDQQAAAGELERLVGDAGFEGVTATVAGDTILLKAIADGLEDAIPPLAAVSVALMVAVVLTVFRARWRLLHLPVVGLALVTAFGIIGWLDVPLTMASTAGLPILVGLSVDFGIQFHTRYEEELELTGEARPALGRSLRHMGPALAVAAVAAILGFAALQYSAVPMVQDFSIVLSIGIAVVFVSCLLALNAVLVHRDRGMRPPPPVPAAPSRIERLLGNLYNGMSGRALPILGAGLAVAAIGFALDPEIAVNTDPDQFLPPDSQALHDVERLSDITATANQLNFLVSAENVGDAAVVRWLDETQTRLLAAEPRLTGAQSLATLVRQGAGTAEPDFSAKTMAELYAGTPPPILSGFVTADRKSASLTFTIARDVRLSDQAPIIEQITRELPPPGVSLAPAGLGVIGIEAQTRLTSNRIAMTALAVGGALILLLLVTRNIVHAVIGMLPVVLVVGWTSAAMLVTGVSLNPLTAIAAPLVVALGTEFSILLLLRYREERKRQLDPGAAMARAYERSGRAIAASALTVTGAFVALAVNQLPLLHDFGRVAVIGVLLSLVGAMVLMPPLLVWADVRMARSRS